MIKGITLTLLKINLETFKTFRGPLLDKLVTGQVLFWGTKYDKPTLIEQKLLLKHIPSKKAILKTMNFASAYLFHITSQRVLD